MARPRKKPDALKVKVTLTLEPRIHQSARQAAYLDGVSLSEKIDELLARYVAISHPELVAQATVTIDDILRLNQQGVAKTLKKQVMRKGKPVTPAKTAKSKVPAHAR